MREHSRIEKFNFKMEIGGKKLYWSNLVRKNKKIN